MREIRCDVAVFGGGAAGLWLLDTLARNGFAVLLLEAYELGGGQTIAAQGIIHGGLKYTLDGLLSASAAAIRDMPHLWRECLAGRRAPDLSGTRIRAEYCHLWRTGSLMSRLGMIGARAALRVAPVRLAATEYPPALAGCRGDVFRLDEQVIDPASFVTVLARTHAARLLRFDPRRLNVERPMAGRIEGLTVCDAAAAAPLSVRAGAIVLTAGAGNAVLQELCGLHAPAMQRRPLHMVMLRGALPVLNGHCTDGARTRVTITTDADQDGRTVWQVGGQVAEDGVGMDEPELIRHAGREMRAALPGLNFSRAEWATYRVDRAEPAVKGGARPSGAFAIRQGNVVTAWPTKLALAPELARSAGQLVREILDSWRRDNKPDVAELSDWPRPRVARPPWERDIEWRRCD